MGSRATRCPATPRRRCRHQGGGTGDGPHADSRVLLPACRRAGYPAKLVLARWRGSPCWCLPVFAGGGPGCGDGAANGPCRESRVTRAGRMTRMAGRGDALDRALEELAGLGDERDQEQIAALRDRLAAVRLRVLVAGEAKRGKSTLVNALLGRPLLPSGVTPLTAVATTVRYGEDPRAEVRFADGHEEKHPLAALDDLVT